MKYLHPYPLIGNYLINDYAKSDKLVSNFIKHYNINEIIFDIWKLMNDTFKETPIKIEEEQMLYKTKDDCLIIISYPYNSDVLIEKVKKTYKDGSFNKVFLYKGKYNLDVLKKLYLGD
jgi:hypothetical protein